MWWEASFGLPFPGLDTIIESLEASIELRLPPSLRRFAPLQLPPILSFSKGYPRCGLPFRIVGPPSMEGVGAPDVAAKACQGESLLR